MNCLTTYPHVSVELRLDSTIAGPKLKWEKRMVELGEINLGMGRINVDEIWKAQKWSNLLHGTC